MMDVVELINPSETRFFDCTCGCNAIAVTAYPDDTDVYVELWEPRGGRTTLRWRISQAWRILRGLGSSEETILSKPMARYLAEHILSITGGR